MTIIQMVLLSQRNTSDTEVISDGQSPNATYSGIYNDKANDGLNGKVSLWVESYDLAGNPIDGGGPGFDNDYVTYVTCHLRIHPFPHSSSR